MRKAIGGLADRFVWVFAKAEGKKRMSRDIDDDFDDDFDVEGDEELIDADSKTKPLEKRLKIDAMLEEQRLNKLKKALLEEDDFDEFDDDFDDE